MSNGLATRLGALLAVSILATAGHAGAQSLAAPSNLTAVAASSSSIRLNWRDNQGTPKEDGFDIERSPNGSSGWAKVGAVGTDVTTFTNTGLSSGVTYWYRVRATRNTSVSGYSNVASAAPTVPTTTSTSTSSTTSTTLSGSTLTAPSSLVATGASASSIRLTWIDINTNEDGFDVERSPNGSSSWVYIGSTGADVTAFTNAGLTSGVVYYYHVRAKRGSSYSAWSNVAFAAPTSSTATTSTSTSSTTIKTTTSTSTTVKTTTSTSTTSTTSTTLAGSGGTANLVGYVPGIGTSLDVAVSTDGLAAMASEEFGMAAVNVTNPSVPVVVGGADKPFRGQHIARRGNRAVVMGQAADGMARLWVMDVTAWNRPIVQGWLATNVAVTSDREYPRVALTPNGGLAIVAMGTSGLWVVDLANPSAPVLRGTLALGGTAWGVAVNSTGTVAYVATGDKGLKVVSLSNPSIPALLATALPSGRYYRDVAVVGTLAFLANQNSTVDVFDVSVASAPVGIGARSIPGYGLRVAAEATQVVVLVATSTGDQVSALDVSVPSNPTLLRTVSIGVPGTGRGVGVANGLTYIAANNDGLRIYDLRSSTTPPPAVLESDFLPRSVSVRSSKSVVLGTYLPTNQVRLKVLDVSVPSTPVIRGQLATSVTSANNVGVALTPNGSLAVAAMGTAGLWVIDVSTPTAPVLRGTLALGGTAWGVAVNSTGSIAYVANGDLGLKIVSLSNPAAPTLLATKLPTGRLYRDVAVVGTIAYLANQNGTLDVFDVTTATNPLGIGARSLSSFAVHVAADGPIVSVLSATSTADQLQMVDATVPTNPVLVSTTVVGVPGTGAGVAKVGSRACVASMDQGLKIYDVTSPSSPVLKSSGTTVGDAYAVAVQSGYSYAYVADYPATLSVVGW